MPSVAAIRGVRKDLGGLARAGLHCVDKEIVVLHEHVHVPDAGFDARRVRWELL